jgi:hypothetical protein
LTIFKGTSKIHLAIFLPSFILQAMLFGTVDSISSFDSYRNSIGKLIETIETKLDVRGKKQHVNVLTKASSFFKNFKQDNELKYSSPDFKTTSIFNINEYDEHENVSMSRVNMLCGYFILEESDLDFTKQACGFMRQLVARWPNNVLIILIVYISHLLLTKILITFFFTQLKYSMFYTICIYKMRKTCNYKISNHLLNSMVDLVLPKVTHIKQFALRKKNKRK